MEGASDVGMTESDPVDDATSLVGGDEAYRAVFEMAPEPAVLIDVDAGRVADVNAAALGLLGLPREQVVGRSPSELIPSLDQRVIAELAAVASQTYGGPMVRRLTGFGSIHLLEISASLIEIGGRRLIHAIGHDVTARVAMERRSERIARLGAVLTELDAVLSDAMTEDQVWRMSAQRLVDLGGMALAAVGLVEINRRDVSIQAVEGIPELKPFAQDAMAGYLRSRDEEVISRLEAGEPYRYQLDPEGGGAGNRAVQLLGELDVALVPIRVGRFMVGIIGCAVRERDFFGLPELSMLTQITRRIANRISELVRSEREQQLAQALFDERERSARFAAAMATIDRDIARVGRAAEIYDALSRLPVELGICFAAWTGMVVGGRGGPRLRIVASAGNFGELPGLLDSARDDLAIRPLDTTETVVVDDVLADARLRRRWKDLERADVRSLVAIPFRVGPTIVGGVAYYAHEVAAFGPEEVALLERVAANAGNRLGAIRADERRWHAEKKLAQMEAISPSNARPGAGPSN